MSKLEIIAFYLTTLWHRVFLKKFYHCSKRLSELLGRDFFYPNEFVMIIDDNTTPHNGVHNLLDYSYCDELLDVLTTAKRCEKNKGRTVGIIQLPAPKTSKEVKGLLGTFRYLRDFGIKYNQNIIVVFKRPDTTNDALNSLFQEVDLGLIYISGHLWVSKERSRVDKGNVPCTTG